MDEQFIKKLTNIKYNKMLNFMDKQITNNLKYARIETRPVKSNGLWCCALLPLILSVYTFIYNVSPIYKAVTCVSIGLLSYSILYIIFLSVSCVVLKESIYGGCIASSLIAALLIYIILGQKLMFSLLVSMPVTFLYCYLLRFAVMRNPKTFTIGEAMLVTQGISLFTVMMGLKITCNTPTEDEEMAFIHAITFTGLSTVGLIVTALYFLSDLDRNVKHFTEIMLTGLVYAIFVLHCIFGLSFMPRLMHFFFFVPHRVHLITFWLSMVVIAILVIMSRTKIALKASTVTRKTFHLLASLVFMSGMLVDVHLMTLAAGVGLGLIILVEALRKSRIEPISSALQSAFLVYSDEKDAGSFAMTPIYLYVGLACPLTLCPRGEALELLSGVLAIGVGDTAASWFGSHYGFYKWLGSERTFEGTAFNIISQIATVYALQLFAVLRAKNVMLRAAFAATVSGLVEAQTEQVDNLILPLVTILAFQATWALS